MFTWALLVTSFALVAKERVFLVCSTWLKAGLMVHKIAVRAFPPSEFCSIRVSFESLYGMWPLLFPPLHTKKHVVNQDSHELQFPTKNYTFKVSNITSCWCEELFIGIQTWHKSKFFSWNNFLILQLHAEAQDEFSSPELSNHCCECQQAAVNMATFFQSCTISICLRDTFTSCEVHKILQYGVLVKLTIHSLWSRM